MPPDQKNHIGCGVPVGYVPRVFGPCSIIGRYALPIAAPDMVGDRPGPAFFPPWVVSLYRERERGMQERQVHAHNNLFP